ncbi:MAG TPA: CARDB domain-containing protein [Pilimelia sp.]|nr:CARDB domain-containing protein [Pilimelia sp.]
MASLLAARPPNRLDRALIVLLLLPALVLLVPPGRSEAAGTKPVSIIITKVACAEDCRNTGLEDAGESAPDFYAKVWINGVEHRTPRAAEDQEYVQPNWLVTQDVPDTQVEVDVAIQIWDQDSTSGDDLGDTSPLADDANLDLKMNTNTAQWTGDGETDSPQNCSTGNGEPGNLIDDRKPMVMVCWDFGPDSDGDGLLDRWETDGVDYNGDGTVDLPLNLAPYNARPDHKDLFVEVDYMACSAGGCAAGDSHSHAPAAGVLTDVTNAFAAAPVSNPDGTGGIRLHAMLDEALQERPNLRFKSRPLGTTDDFQDIKLGNPAGPCTGSFGTPADRAAANCANILLARKNVFRYAIFAHSFGESPTASGTSELGTRPGNRFTGGQYAVGGDTFLVTLGNWGDEAIESAGGQRPAEAGTFMHELGHTLALQHGGGDEVNCKPNYLSVMNYTLQLPDLDPTRPLDYSSPATGTTLGTLNEGALSERDGIKGPAGRLAIYGVGGATKTAPANGAINWNGVRGIEGGTVPADINRINEITKCAPTSPGEELHGHDDWASLVYNFRNSPFFADGHYAASGADDELTSEDALRMNPLADLTVTKSVDKADAVGGDTLTYTVPVTNLGPAEAMEVSLTDTLPDGSTQTRSLPNLAAGAVNTQTFTHNVSCGVADGTVLTNRVTVTGKNPRGFPDGDLSNNTAQVATTVHAPAMTLAKTATGAANAGEAITYTLTYQNTGSGSASGVTVTDTLPADVYYSIGLDQGAGPRPSTVTKNPDGTTTLTWNIGDVAAASGARTITYTARTSLLTLPGTGESSTATLRFQNASGCGFAPINATATTTVTAVPPTRNPLTMGYWKNHPEEWTAEMLARIQATDRRYDGADGSTPDGKLTAGELTAAFAPPGTYPKVTSTQLLATYFNLATRRINAGTVISSRTSVRLGLTNVRAAALYAQATLLLPVNASTTDRYSDTTTVLDEINSNRSEVY